MKYALTLSKMIVQNNTPINYFLKTNSEQISCNTFLQKKISLQFLNQINCSVCNRKIKKSFFEGLCYPCFQSSPQASECIVRPELCRAHLGEGRDIEWEEKHHNQEHCVYLSNTTGMKVGVTRSSHIPSRWIDQGATEGVIIARTPNRFLAGCIEVALKAHISDKTAWQRMLKLSHVEFDLEKKRDSLIPHLPDSLQQYCVKESPLSLCFPVFEYPKKIVSISLDKHPNFTGILSGIKGQYFIFSSGEVCNIRKHTGYKVSLTVEQP
jgi:hypothetical protein